MQKSIMENNRRLLELLKEKDAQIAELKGQIDHLHGYPAQTNQASYLKGYLKQQGTPQNARAH